MSTVLDSNRNLAATAGVLVAVILAAVLGFVLTKPSPFDLAMSKCAAAGGIGTGVNESNDSIEDVYATQTNPAHRWYIVSGDSRTEVEAINGDFFCEAKGQTEGFHVILFPIPVN